MEDSETKCCLIVYGRQKNKSLPYCFWRIVKQKLVQYLMEDSKTRACPIVYGGQLNKRLPYSLWMTIKQKVAL